MAKQLDLLPSDQLSLKPKKGLKEPLLWVRRLVIWSAPGTVVRDIALRKGLNIIWSPDPSDRGPATTGAPAPLGHGSGKTLFCRLLRYCLGEDSYAPDVQRQAVASALNEGLVGAEVVVAGTTWAVLRSIGTVRRTLALPNGTLETMVSDNRDDTGMDPFLAAVEGEVLSEDVAKLLSPEGKRRAWPIALAWLTRDQEVVLAMQWTGDRPPPIRLPRHEA